MPSSIFSLAWVLASVSFNGGQGGDDAGLWAAIITMFVAIVLVGGSLTVYIIRVVKKIGSETHGDGPPMP